MRQTTANNNNFYFSEILVKFKVIKNGSKASGSVKSFNTPFDTEEESLYDQITTHVKNTFPTQQFELLFSDNNQLITPESLDNQSNVTRAFDKGIVVGECFFCFYYLAPK